MPKFFSRKNKQEKLPLSKQDGPWLIVGLGNPGRQYEKTWHNVGFMVIEILSQRHALAVSRLRFKGLYGRGQIKGQNVILLKPNTFMNLSGESLQEAAAYFRVPMDKILVIYDDIDINIGQLRIRPWGGTGTHKGMKSIVKHLSSKAFPRVRIGIGPLPSQWQLMDYVLAEIDASKQKLLYEALELAADAVEIALEQGIERAMSACNKRGQSD